jgi:2-methylisocitrate lyase-like PEP mutase family enzyme
VLALPGAPAVPELAELGVARVSVGGGFAFAAAGALVAAGRELLSEGTYRFWETAGPGAKAAREAFS